ncbi:MAG: succinate dehydrogenase assembly factor 2, partial [Rhodospirillales bacterium]
MPDSTDPRRKRLLFRCKHMGMAENDILFGRFAESRLGSMSEGQLRRLEKLLEENDIDLFKWVSGKEPPPKAHDHDVMALLQG